MNLGTKIAEGREAEVYAWDGGTAILKLYRPGYAGHFAETSALSKIGGLGVAPGLIESIEVDGRPGLVLERLAGADMLALLERQPWHLLGLARAFATCHLRVHEVQAPEDLPELRDVLAGRITSAVERPELRDFALRILDRLPSGDRLCHGDFHPGNVLVAGDQARVIDWSNATRGVPASDFARTMLLLTRAAPLPSMSLLFRGLMATGRSAFAHTYARVYRRRSLQTPVQVSAWTTVHIAARLAEGIEEEHPQLVAALDRAWRTANR